jgi:Cd2+/Zn2+-exporting ATPase
MLTGDGRETARKIAEECGIINGSENEIVMTSSELEKMSDEEVARILPNLRVLARALPQDKMCLVKISQELDLVVGMTGDGINDAPVMSIADVSIAMGKAGSDVAIEAADIVLMNDRPSEVINALKISKKTMRIVYQNIIFALGSKGIVLILGALGYANMWIALFADVGILILATLNAMRTLKKQRYIT